MENYDPRRRQANEDSSRRKRSRHEEGPREEQRYGQGSGSSFSPDWSREGAEPRHSDDPYYSRNREHDEQGHDVQRSRDDEQQGQYRGYYSRSSTPFSYAGGTGYVYSESWTLVGPHTGRGPKGYRRSDQQILEEACLRLERAGEIDATEIEVTAEDGVIRLRGTVPDRATKRCAEECVESVYGARDVMNELRVSSQGSEESQSVKSSQGSQPSQRSQGARGSQPPPAQSTTAEQSGGDDKRTPKH
jgi:hypothetical protein